MGDVFDEVAKDVPKTATPASAAKPEGDVFDQIAKEPVKAAAKNKAGFLDREIPLSSYGNATLSGLQSVGRGVRDAVVGTGTMIAHPVDTAKSILAIPSQAKQVPAAIRDINASADPMGTYAKVGQETAGQGAGQALTALGTAGALKALPKAINAIPNVERAGQAFNDVKSVAKAIPIDTTAPGNTALEIRRMAESGGTMPKVVRDFVTRATAPGKGPITYEEARDFYSNASRLSADETNRLTPNLKRMAGRFRSDLGTSIQDAANRAGVGEKYSDAMSEYRNAMRVKAVKQGLKEAAIGGLKYGIPAGAGGYLARKAIDLAQ